jgi:ubiquinone/menaquinone biosynthesis C-methylase UbiE
VLEKFKTRSDRKERIDTGDYTAAEYRRFLREIAFINRHFGDKRALERSLFRYIEERGLREFSLLDVGSGSGELLRTTAEWAHATGRHARLAGIDLSPISAATAVPDGSGIEHLRGDARALPFDDGAFDFVFASLFFHHLTDAAAADVLAEMRRVARVSVTVIDLNRHPGAWVMYRLMCAAFSISPLVREDGSLSIMRAFKPGELSAIAAAAGASDIGESRSFPFRIVLRTDGAG